MVKKERKKVYKRTWLSEQVVVYTESTLFSDTLFKYLFHILTKHLSHIQK